MKNIQAVLLKDAWFHNRESALTRFENQMKTK